MVKQYSKLADLTKTHVCYRCKVTLIPNINWNPSHIKCSCYICKSCNNKKSMEFRLKKRSEHQMEDELWFN